MNCVKMASLNNNSVGSTNIHTISNLDIGYVVSQVNLHKSITPVIYLNEWFNSYKCNYMESIGKIALIQEPYLNAFTKQPSGFFKESKLFVGAKKDKIRACILTDNSVNAWQINQFCNNDMVTIGIKSDNKIYILCSLYMP